jgi:hypothetical protein
MWSQESEMRIEYSVRPVTYPKTKAAKLLRSMD